MPFPKVQISRFVDEHQRGFDDCVLLDAQDQTHLFVGKSPIVSAERLWSDSRYSRPGEIACDIETEQTDESGRSLVRVNSNLPWRVESTTGETRFVEFPSRIVRATS
jgi:hypothetical protein